MKIFIIFFLMCSIANQLKAYPSPEKEEKNAVNYRIGGIELKPEDILRVLSELTESQPVKEDKKDIKEDIKKGDTKAMKEGDTKQNGTVASNYFDQEIKRAFETTFTNIKDGIFNLFGRK